MHIQMFHKELYKIVRAFALKGSVGYRTGNHYRLSEYTGRLIID